MHEHEHEHLAVAHAARIYFPSIPEDLYAFPKFRVSFLNGFPLLNETAHKWLTEGLQGGEDEFLGRDPHRDGHSSNLRKEISENAVATYKQYFLQKGLEIRYESVIASLGIRNGNFDDLI